MMEMRYIAKDIPLWQVTIWDKKFNNVDKKWQPKTIKYKYLLSDELDSLRVDDGDVRILYTGKDVGFTTEELAGDRLSEGEIISIPWGGIPTVKYHKGKFVTGDNRIATSKDIDKLTNKYLYYFMRGNIHEIASYYRGASLKHPCMKDILKMTISYPSVQEQDKICGQFDVLEQIIEVRKQELQLLDDLIKARFVEMFGHQSHNEKSLPYMTIDDVAEIYLGITHTPTYVDSGVVFISAKNTSGDFLDLSDVKYISREEFEGAPKGSKPQVNDVLFSRVGSNLGHPVILKEELELCTFVSLGFLRSKGSVTSNYLKHWMRDEFFEKQVSEHVKGGGQPNLNTGWLKEFKIIVPDLEKQKEFDDFCNQVDKSKVAVQKALDETQLLFDSLMQKYFG